jgi:hypothetical protein
VLILINFIFMKKLLILWAFLLVLPLAVQAKKPDVPPGINKQVHPAGTNVVSPDGTLWLITDTSERRPYISDTAFTSYAFNSFSFVVSASKGDLVLPVGSFIAPRDGKIVVSNNSIDNGTIYVMSNAQKVGFVSGAVFSGLGYSFSSAITSTLSGVSYGAVLSSTTQAHPEGSLINQGGTVLYVGANGKYGIPDLATFNSWGFNFSEVLPATAGDTALSQVGELPARLAGQLNPSIE